MDILSRAVQVRSAVNALRAEGKRIGFVPTMGYLHEGHLSLVRIAREHVDEVIASIFVNPTQFGPGEDLEAYPRDLPRDCDLLVKEGVRFVFHPPPEEMYPPGCVTTVDPGPLAERLCGAERPGHFRGVATVVLKLFEILRPHMAVFGQKDAQQCAVIERLVRDLNLDVEILRAPTVREPDGLALSSRNTYLSPEERKAAPVLYRALRAGEELVRAGERAGPRVQSAIQETLSGEPLVASVDYAAVVDGRTLEDLKRLRGDVLLASAIRIGKTRLIDNIPLDVGEE